MSHIVTIAVEVRDLAAVQAACKRLDLEEPLFGTNVARWIAVGAAAPLPTTRSCYSLVSTSAAT